MDKKIKLVLLCLVIFIGLAALYPAVNNFFVSDDFYNFSISKANNLKEFVQFFSFKNKKLPFYRPLPLQAFYFIAKSILGFNYLFYHLFSLLFLIGAFFLVYKISFQIFKNKDASLIALIIYSLSYSHVLRIAWITQIQENMLAFFSLATIFFFIRFCKTNIFKIYFLTLLSFILSLLSKETAVVTPLILSLFSFWIFKDFKKTKKQIFYLIPFFVITIIYLYLRIFVMKLPEGSVYQPDLSIGKLLNSTFWYTLWSFNIAEMFVDFIGPGFNINPRLLNEFALFTYLSFFSFVSLLFFLFLKIKNRLIKLLKQKHKILIFFTLGYIFYLLPVLTLPWHKFAYSLSMPHFFVSLILTQILYKINWKTFTFLFTYTFLFVITNIFNYQYHWIFTRGKTAKKVYQHFNSNYSQLKNKNILFTNTNVVNKHWGGESKQVALAMFEQTGFKVLFPESGMNIYFEDFNPPEDLEYHKIPAKKFVN